MWSIIFIFFIQNSSNKIYFDESKKNELAYREIDLLKFLQFKTVDGLAITDLNDIVMCQFLRDGVQFNNKRLKNVGDPVDENDAVNKKYVDNRNEDLNINGRRLNLDRNKQSYILHGKENNKDVVFIISSKMYITNPENVNLFEFSQGGLSVKNKRITDLADPSVSSDAVNKKYVDNQLGSMPITASGRSSDLNSNHFKILNLTDPTVSSDAVNKKYVDRQITLVNSKITNPQTPEFKRYSDYQHIKEIFKPTFWISGHYNNGLKIDNDSTRVNDTLIELTGSGYVTNGTFSHANGVFRFTKTNNFNIVSTTSYKTHYTFFFIASQDVGAKGRLFTNNIGNRLFGYWNNKYGSLWIDVNINVNGKGVNDGKRYLFTLRNDIGKKMAFINNEQYILILLMGEDIGEKLLLE